MKHLIDPPALAASHMLESQFVLDKTIFAIRGQSFHMIHNDKYSSTQVHNDKYSGVSRLTHLAKEAGQIQITL